ncbi:hypothetical protein FPQ18DRAFT_307030 [Pyronema domesticum]|nr:hypothetical protein FPQ18DRAFT_307030 [Pyronema domesticum]
MEDFRDFSTAPPTALPADPMTDPLTAPPTAVPEAPTTPLTCPPRAPATAPTTSLPAAPTAPLTAPPKAPLRVPAAAPTAPPTAPVAAPPKLLRQPPRTPLTRRISGKQGFQRGRSRKKTKMRRRQEGIECRNLAEAGLLRLLSSEDDEVQEDGKEEDCGHDTM